MHFVNELNYFFDKELISMNFNYGFLTIFYIIVSKYLLIEFLLTILFEKMFYDIYNMIKMFYDKEKKHNKIVKICLANFRFRNDFKYEIIFNNENDCKMYNY